MIAFERDEFMPIAATCRGVLRRCSPSPRGCVVSFVVTDVLVVKYERDREVDGPLAVPAGDGDRRLERGVARGRDR